MAGEGTPTAAEARSTLALVFGAAYDGVPHGAGASLLDHLDHLRAATKKGDAEAASTSRAAFQADAGAALSVLEGLRETAQTEAQQSDIAALEAHLLPGEGPLKALERYERHLQRELLGAVRGLERAVAERRLIAVLRGRWG